MPSVVTDPTSRLRASEYEGTPVGPEAHGAIHLGRCALITGAASGIGFAIAKELAGYVTFGRTCLIVFSFPFPIDLASA